MNKKRCNFVPLRIQKIDSVSGTGISGAVFALIDSKGCICNGITDTYGSLTFNVFLCASYKLKEIIPPTGYAPANHTYNICVDICGCIFVDGVHIPQLIIRNTPIPNLFNDFVFRKFDSSTGLPLANATFTLMQNGTTITTVTSGADGLINFGILTPGTYQLTETAAPPGFTPNSTIYQVIVAANGYITVNGIPLDDFAVQDIPISIEISATPVINTILEGDTVITGIGIPGSAITVILPSGATVTTTVNSSGTWTANVPSGIILFIGDIVFANQTEIGKIVSDYANIIVIGNTNIVPNIDIFVENLTTGLDSAQLGDTLLYDVIISNAGTVSSIWQSAYVIFSLNSAITLQVNSIRINNRTVTPEQYNYDSIANTLTIFLGDIVGGNGVSVSYRVTVNSGISDINEIIVDIVSGSLI